MSSRAGFKDHIYKLMLDRKLYLATVKLQADNGLGKCFSAMLPFVEGLHKLGYLSDADFEVYKAKYSARLDAEPKTVVQIKAQETKENRDRQLNRNYKLVFEQWSTLSEKARVYHLRKANEDNRLIWARRLLEKVQDMEAKE